MRLLQFSTIAAGWALVGSTVVAESSARHDDGILARGSSSHSMDAARISPPRNLKPGSSGGGDPSDCCEFIAELLRLDQYCSDAIAELETAIACEDSYGIISSSSSSLPFEAYSSAVNKFDGYLLDYELGVFPDLSGLDCTVDSLGVDIELATFGGFCLFGDVIVVDSVNPPIFTYTQPVIPFPVTDLIFTIPAP